MDSAGASFADLIELSPELAAKALVVPGLPDRLVRFIRMEVAMNERRQLRYSPEALSLVQRARDLAEKRREEGESREEGMAAVARNLAKITDAL